MYPEVLLHVFWSGEGLDIKFITFCAIGKFNSSICLGERFQWGQMFLWQLSRMGIPLYLGRLPLTSCCIFKTGNKGRSRPYKIKPSKCFNSCLLYWELKGALTGFSLQSGCQFFQTDWSKKPMQVYGGWRASKGIRLLSTHLRVHKGMERKMQQCWIFLYFRRIHILQTRGYPKQDSKSFAIEPAEDLLSEGSCQTDIHASSDLIQQGNPPPSNCGPYDSGLKWSFV